MAVFVANEQPIEVDEENLMRLARLAMGELGVEESELSVLIVDSDAMRRLNARWMGQDRPTDVLAFPMDEEAPEYDEEEEEEAEPWLLGDVVLCPEVARENAESLGRGLGEELELLCVHGILHCAGYDHTDGEEEKEMTEETERLLTLHHGEK
ncbi:MAG: rRNA maturation RNase YbeY [Actinomycetota bacterium]